MGVCLKNRIQPVLSQGGPRPAALRVVGDAADTLCAAVLQPPPSRGQALSDPGMEDLLYEAESVRRFVGLRLSGPLPDETTILNFRHLLEERQLGEGLMEEINRHLATQGLRLREGTIVDASIIEAPSSTKNGAGERDPQMRQTKKGNEWRFGMKVHIGVDAETGVVHSMSTTSANVHDVTEAHRLLHGGEKRVWGDAGYQGVAKRDENRGLDVEWRVAMRPSRRRQLERGSEAAVEERRKASITGQGGASVSVGEADASGTPRFDIGDWPRTRNGWRCCWGLPTS